MILLDTNILLYMYDKLEVARQAQALSVVERLNASRKGWISAQVLAEFCHAGTRKLRLDKAFVLQQAELLASSWPIIELSSAIVLEAARGVRDHSLAYFDAQIWATAKLNQIPVIFSEDFNSGATLEGVRFVNPFASTFNLDDWV